MTSFNKTFNDNRSIKVLIVPIGNDIRSIYLYFNLITILYMNLILILLFINTIKTIGTNSMYDKHFDIISNLKEINMYELTRPSSW